jgi:hypothetical protein
MPDLGRPHAAGLQILDQRDVGRSPADVQRQDVADNTILADPKRAGHTTGRPRHQ